MLRDNSTETAHYANLYKNNRITFFFWTNLVSFDNSKFHDFFICWKIKLCAASIVIIISTMNHHVLLYWIQRGIRRQICVRRHWKKDDPEIIAHLFINSLLTGNVTYEFVLLTAENTQKSVEMRKRWCFPVSQNQESSRCRKSVWPWSVFGFAKAQLEATRTTATQEVASQQKDNSFIPW